MAPTTAGRSGPTATVPAAALVERRVHLAHPDDVDPAWNPRRPELSFAADAVSLLMPYAEPYFVRTVRRAVPELDPPLARTATAFCAPGGAPPRRAPPAQRPHGP